MGADGGSIPTRTDLVKTKKKEEKADPFEVARVRWTLCQLSKEPLKSPVVVDQLGLLYNKETIIKHLLDKDMPKAFKHIRSLKDVMDIHFKPNPRYNPKNEIDATRLNITDCATESPFICPITNLEVGVNHKFSMLRSCGCSFSERALKECPSETCLVCNKPYTAADIFPLNPDEEELQEKKIALEERLKEERKEKKLKAESSKMSSKEKNSKESQQPKESVDSGKEKKRKKEEGGNFEHLDQKKSKKISGALDLSLMSKPKEKKSLNIPTNATPTIYASLFTSSIKEPQIKESFLCRNVSRG